MPDSYLQTQKTNDIFSAFLSQLKGGEAKLKAENFFKSEMM